jgi:hypothetical protein
VLLKGQHFSIVLNEHFEEGAIVFREACKLGCEGIVSNRLGSPYRPGRSALGEGQKPEGTGCEARSGRGLEPTNSGSPQVEQQKHECASRQH